MKRIFTKEHVRVQKEESLFKGFFQIKKYFLQHKLFQGGWSKPFERELFERGSAVGVLLFDPKAELFIILEQFRVGCLSQDGSPWLYEIVAGVIETGESPEEVAKREVLEETGCQLEKLYKMPDYWVSPGGTSEYVHLYLGLTDSKQTQDYAGLADEQEDIKVHKLNRTQLLGLLNDGKLNNAMALIAIQWFLLNEKHLNLSD